MDATQIVLVVFGAIAFLAVGSFTCVIIDRLPVPLDEPNLVGDQWDTRPWAQVFGGTSRCSSCGADVRAVNNVPVISWMMLRGKCRSCGDRIPGFHPIVELTSPLLFLAAIYMIGLNWKLLPALWFIPVGLAISVIDLRTLIVPTRIVWPATAISGILMVIVCAIEGEWLWLRSAGIGLAVMAGPLFLIWFIFPKGMGFGDVRLATFVGLNVGFYAGVLESTRPAAPVFLVVLSMALASVLGIIIGVAALGARGRKAQVPFGPSMLASGYFCMLMASQILTPFQI